MPHVSDASSTDAPKIVLWELRGRTGMPATCALHQPPKRAVVLTVHIGHELVTSECYPDSESALMRGRTVREQLAEKGWLTTYDREDSSCR